MSEELKPCPFCGNVHEITETWYDGPLYGVEGDGCPVWVTAFEEDDTREREKVVNLYNSRPIEDALRAELEAERQKMQELSAALEWYADEQNFDADGTLFSVDGTYTDKGARARRALGKK